MDPSKGETGGKNSSSLMLASIETSNPRAINHPPPPLTKSPLGQPFNNPSLVSIRLLLFLNLVLASHVIPNIYECCWTLSPLLCSHIDQAAKMLSQQSLWLLFLSIPIVLLLFKQLTRDRQDPKLPPGPWKLPILGNLHQLGPKPHDSLSDLSRRYGPLMFLKLGSVPTVVISSDEVAQEVFKSHDATFSNRPLLYGSRKLSYDRLDMAWSSYGEYWRQLRKVSMIEILSSKRVESFQSVREDEVARLIAYIRSVSASSPSATIDLSKMMLTLVNNVVCRIMFGDKFKGSIGKYDEGGSRFFETIEETMKLLGAFCIADYFPSLEWIHKFTGLKKRLDKNFAELDSFYEEMIQQHINNRSAPDHQDLVHVLLSLHKDPTYSSTFGTMDNIKAFLTDVVVILGLPLGVHPRSHATRLSILIGV